MFNNFYTGKRVLITGHAGFKGSWLTFWLYMLGAEVSGYSLLPDSNPRLYEILKLSSFLSHELIADIRDAQKLKHFVAEVKPEIVIHLAAQPLVFESYRDPFGTYATNVMGTLNLLQSGRECASVKALVNVTTDKVYENLEDGRAYSEQDRLGGYDMYSSSKACSEILSSSFRRSFLDKPESLLLATARAGNVIGGGDFSADRLVPDCMRALSAGRSVLLRHPKANRPWQFVLEPLAGYLTLAKALYEGRKDLADSFNFGPETGQIKSVCEMAELMVKIWGCGNVQCTDEDGAHEAALLRLDNRKAQQQLQILPVLDVQRALEVTVKWYQAYFSGNADMLQFTADQINTFALTAADKHLAWSK